MSELVNTSDSSVQPNPKKSKLDSVDIPSSVIVVFVNQDGERVGSGPIDVPVNSTTKQLEVFNIAAIALHHHR
jgi:hypothetical protein